MRGEGRCPCKRVELGVSFLRVRACENDSMCRVCCVARVSEMEEQQQKVPLHVHVYAISKRKIDDGVE